MGTTTPFESASSSRVIPPPWRWRGWLFADLPRSPLDRWCWVPGVLAIIWPVEHEPNRGSSRRNPNRGVPETKPVLRVEFLGVSRTLVGFWHVVLYLVLGISQMNIPSRIVLDRTHPPRSNPTHIWKEPEPGRMLGNAQASRSHDSLMIVSPNVLQPGRVVGV